MKNWGWFVVLVIVCIFISVAVFAGIMSSDMSEESKMFWLLMLFK